MSGVDGFLHYVGGMEVSQEPGIERLLGLKASCESFLLLLESCSERSLREKVYVLLNRMEPSISLNTSISISPYRYLAIGSLGSDIT